MECGMTISEENSTTPLLHAFSVPCFYWIRRGRGWGLLYNEILETFAFSGRNFVYHSKTSRHTMKIRRVIPFVVLSTLGSTVGSAQSKNEEPRENRFEEIGNRVGTEIEQFVTRIARIVDPDVDGFFDNDSLPSKRRRRTVSADLESESNTFTYEGNKTIEESQTLNGNIVVKGGDLTVFGTIDGDVLVVGGTLHVKDGGHITGNARVISGDVIREDGSKIDGYVDKSRASTAGYREDARKFTRPGTSFNAPWLTETSSLENFIFRYNRVEGLFLGLGSEKKYYWDGRKTGTGNAVFLQHLLPA